MRQCLKSRSLNYVSAIQPPRSYHGDKEPGLFVVTQQQPIFRHLLDLRIQTEDCIGN